MEVRTIGVIGAGPAGRRIAFAAARGGYRTILEDVSPRMLEEGIAHIESGLEESVARNELTQPERDAILANLSTANRVDEVCREADLLIETVPEEMEVKLEIFTIFDKFAKPEAILASNTSSLSIEEIAAITFRTEDCVGMRFSDSGPNLQRLEIIRGPETSDTTVATCLEVGRRMGKDVAVRCESPESIGNADADNGPRKKGFSR